MFTGIVAELGEVAALERHGDAAQRVAVGDVRVGGRGQLALAEQFPRQAFVPHAVEQVVIAEGPEEQG